MILVGGLGFRVSRGFGFRVLGLEFRVSGKLHLRSVCNHQIDLEQFDPSRLARRPNIPLIKEVSSLEYRKKPSAVYVSS